MAVTATNTHKKLLSFLSKDHLEKQENLNKRLGSGAIFFPSIDKKQEENRSQLKHLQLIEQYIISENKREEKLSKCSTEKERRFWTRKFQNQREHERQLIESIMLGKTEPEEMEKEIDYVTKFNTKFKMEQQSSSIRTGSKSVPKKIYSTTATSTGFKSFSALKKATMSTTTTSNRKQHQTRLSSPQLHISKGPRTGSCQHIKLKMKRKKKKKKQKKSGHKSNESDYETDTDCLCCRHHVLPITFESAKSYLEARNLAAAGGATNVTIVEGTTQTTADQDMTIVLTENPFPQERGITAGALARSILGLEVTSGTSSTEIPKLRPHSSPVGRSYSLDTLVSPRQLKALGTVDKSPFAKPRVFKESFLNADGVLTYISEDLQRKIHFLPKKKLPQMNITTCATVGDELILEAASKGLLKRKNTLEALVPTKKEETEVRDDEEEDDDEKDDTEQEQTVREEEGKEVKEQEEQNTTDQGIVYEPTETDHTEDDNTTRSNEEAYWYENPDDAWSYPHPDDSVYNAEDYYGEDSYYYYGDQYLDHDSYQVHQVIEDLVRCIEESEDPTRPTTGYSNSGSRPTSPIPQLDDEEYEKYLSRLIKAQSMFRGYKSRKTFRQALHKEALKCGVLGAMPGTIQGKSGWYQDPKSLFVFYFKVTAHPPSSENDKSGQLDKEPVEEWKQKIAMKCSHLILSPYQMHKEILSKVYITNHD